MAAGEPVTEVEPVTPAVLADRIAESALGLLRGGARRWVRVGVDGPVADDGAALADAVSAALADRAVPVARVGAERFLRARSLRLEYGPADPDGFRHGWYDQDALIREVLAPLGPGGNGRWLPGLRDPETDRALRDPRCDAPTGTVLVLDGRFLAGMPLHERLDLVVLLEVGADARARRVPEAEAARVLPAWAAYLEQERPDRVAHLVVRYDHPRRPALLSARPPRRPRSDGRTSSR